MLMWAPTTREAERLNAGYNIIMGQGEDSYGTMDMPYSSHLYHHLQEKYDSSTLKALMA